MNELVKQMQEDAASIPSNNLEKIGAVATDIADTQEEISKLKENLKKIIPFVGFDSPKEDGSPRVYVCQNFTCKLPTSDFNVVKEQLGRR